MNGARTLPGCERRVAGIMLPANGRRVSGSTITLPGRRSLKSPLLSGTTGDDIVEGSALPQARALVIGEEEDSVLLDGAANRAAELVTLERLAICHEEIAGVELLIAKELEQVAVELNSCRSSARPRSCSGCGRTRAPCCRRAP